MKSRSVYLDHAATTPLRPGVLEAMMPFFSSAYGNPSGLYHAGRQTRLTLDEARDKLADLLGCQAGEVYFTSGGSEADNLAIKGYAWANRSRGRHILVSAVEHHAVLEAADHLAGQGFEIEHIPVNAAGQVVADELLGMFRPDTILVSVMHSNNEVGSLQPVAELAALCRERKVALHTDAVQSIGHVPVSFVQLGATMLSLSAHKFGGPKGVGALVLKSGNQVTPLIHGGGQERELRAGTENVAGVVGMVTALEHAVASQDEESKQLSSLAAKLRTGLLSIPGIIFSGHQTQRLPGNVHVCIPKVSGDSLIMNLDMAGIAASSGSACSAGAVQISHVLLAMMIPQEIAQGALRMTLGHTTTASDVERILQVLPPLVEKLRARNTC